LRNLFGPGEVMEMQEGRDFSDLLDVGVQMRCVSLM
jgi:hypothetical protein